MVCTETGFCCIFSFHYVNYVVVGMRGAPGVIWAGGGQVLQAQWESGGKSADEGTALHS